MKTKKLVIIGATETAKLAYHYFTIDSEYEIVAFAADKQYLSEDELYGLPIYPLETIETILPPNEYDAFVAVGSNKLNTNRTKLYREAKGKGYKLASYISSKATIGAEVQIGDNCFIQEGNNIQSFVKIGNNVTLWAGNHIGHRTVVHDNCFITSHVVISGWCEIGAYTFIGVNCCVADEIKIGEKSLIGLGCIIGKDVEANSIMRMTYAKQHPITATRFNGIDNFDF